MRCVPRAGWEDDANCRLMGHSVFFGDGEHPMSTSQVQTAQAICRFCPVWVDCLYTALARNEPHGVWGGLTVRSRTILMKRANGSAINAMRILFRERLKVGK